MNKTILLVLVTILLGLTFFKVKNIVMENDVIKAIKKLKEKDNLTFEESKLLEQLYRNETAHFKSGQFLDTLSAGMEVHNNTYPYGWTSLAKSLWTNKRLRPIGFSQHKENETGYQKRFLKFPSLYTAMLANLTMARIYKNEGGFYRWYSTNKEKQEIYKSRLNSIIPKLTYKIYNI